MRTQINKHLTIIKLIFRSNAWLLTVAVWALPVSLTLSIVSILFVDNLLVSYERYLKSCYIGYQGRVSVEGDHKLLKAAALASEQEGWNYSPRIDLPAGINFFYQDRVIMKNLKVVILDDDYLVNKFKDIKISPDSRSFIVNAVFQKGLGEIDLDLIKRFQVVNSETIHDIKNFFVVDTGFLSDIPLLFLSKGYASTIFDLKGKGYSKIEFMETSEQTIRDIKERVKLLAKKVKAQRVKISDLLFDSKDTSKLFNKIYRIEWVIVGFVLFLIVCIISFSMSIIISFKRNSLDTLMLLGFTAKDVSHTLAIAMAAIFAVSALAGTGFIAPLRGIFLKNSSLADGFFIEIDAVRQAGLYAAGVIFVVVSLITSRASF